MNIKDKEINSFSIIFPDHIMFVNGECMTIHDMPIIDKGIITINWGDLYSGTGSIQYITPQYKPSKPIKFNLDDYQIYLDMWYKTKVEHGKQEAIGAGLKLDDNNNLIINLDSQQLAIEATAHKVIADTRWLVERHTRQTLRNQKTSLTAKEFDEVCDLIDKASSKIKLTKSIRNTEIIKNQQAKSIKNIKLTAKETLDYYTNILAAHTI